LSKVSVITVVYNGAETLQEAIESVLSQDHPNIEYIIMDGGSSDGTLEIIQSFQNKLAYVESSPDKGMYHAMNKALRHCTGDWIAILNADDTYANPSVLSRIQSCFDTSQCDAVYGDLVYVQKDDTSKITRYWKSGKYNRKQFLWGWMPPHPAFFLKRSAYLQYGFFNEALKTAADYELMLRMLFKHKLSAVWCPGIMVKMRVGGVSNAGISNRVHANREDRKAWEINTIRPYFFTLALKPVRKILQFWQRPPQ
jgi:glycosyltransferase involved in cell wall biosynthesis